MLPGPALPAPRPGAAAGPLSAYLALDEGPGQLIVAFQVHPESGGDLQHHRLKLQRRLHGDRLLAVDGLLSFWVRPRSSISSARYSPGGMATSGYESVLVAMVGLL